MANDALEMLVHTNVLRKKAYCAEKNMTSTHQHFLPAVLPNRLLTAALPNLMNLSSMATSSPTAAITRVSDSLSSGQIHVSSVRGRVGGSGMPGRGMPCISNTLLPAAAVGSDGTTSAFLLLLLPLLKGAASAGTAAPSPSGPAAEEFAGAAMGCGIGLPLLLLLLGSSALDW